MATYVYTVSFNSEGIDESAFREIVERQLKGSSVTITRSGGSNRMSGFPPVPVTTNVSKKPSVIFDLLQDNNLRRLPQIVEETGLDEKRARNEVNNLLRRSEIAKYGHGVYGSFNVPKDQRARPPRASDQVRSQGTLRSTLSLIAERPQSAVELRIVLKVSRQRVDQILSRLTKRGLIERQEVSGEVGRYVYHIVKTDSRPHQPRTAVFHSTRAKMLSSLSPDAVYCVSDFAKRYEISPNSAGNYVTDLQRAGLVAVFNIRSVRYFYLLPEGAAHPQYSTNAIRVEGINLFEQLGEIRSSLLLNLSVLQEAKSIDLTYSLEKNAFADVGYSTGQLIQRLKIADLIEERHEEDGRHPTYGLTPQGLFVVGLLARFRTPLSFQALKDRIASRMEQRADLLRKSHLAGRVGDLAPSYLQILWVLKRTPDLPSIEIPGRMQQPYKNPASVDTAIRQLEDRGYVHRLAATNGKAKFLWRLTEAGRAKTESYAFESS